MMLKSFIAVDLWPVLRRRKCYTVRLLFRGTLGSHSFPYQSLLLCSTIIHNDKIMQLQQGISRCWTEKNKMCG